MKKPALLLSLLLLAFGRLDAQDAVILTTIGGEESRGAELGSIRNVLVLPQHIVVLERDAPFLRVFDFDGTQVQVIGRKGAGPGEFNAPTGIAWDSAGQRLLVVDPSNARVSTYPVADSLGAPTLLALEEIGVRKMCSVGGTLYGINRQSEHLVQALVIRDGRVAGVRSFGIRRTAHPLGKHRLVSTRVNDGPFLCDEASGTMYIGSAMLGELQVIDIGTLAQRSLPIPGFSGIDLSIEDGGSTLRQSVPEAGMELFENIVNGPDGILLVLGKWSRQPGARPAPVGYEAIPLTDGALGIRASHDAMPVGYTPRGIVCVAANPYPTITIVEGKRCH